MPAQRKETSRRSLLRGFALGAGVAVLRPSQAIAGFPTGGTVGAPNPPVTSTPLPCLVGFDYGTYTMNALGLTNAIATQTNPGAFSTAAAEHSIAVGYYSGTSYAVGASTTETRFLLTVDVGVAPAQNLFHPVEAGALAARNSITDIYVFNQADNSLLFWKKIGSLEVSPSALFVVPSAIVAAKPKISIVVRCAQHGYWGQDYDLGNTALDYSSAVGTADPAKICQGSSVARPYLAPGATGGQGDLGILHRPNIIKVANDQVLVFLGGDLTGNGKHPAFGTDHYVMGGVLHDQNGNLLSASRTIVYSKANDQQILFTGLNLAGSNVTTLRATLMDCKQGRFMGFLDL